MGDDSKDHNRADAELFRGAMKGVRRLSSDNLVVRKTPPAPMPTQSRRDIDAVLIEMASGKSCVDGLQYGDDDAYHRPSVSHSVMRKLRRGKFSVQAEFDLHGLSVAAAKSNLATFIRYSTQRGLVCVRVIHGKGHRSPGKLPVLKPRVARWLAQHNNVLAFTSAKQVDGGTGALYVLLKRH